MTTRDNREGTPDVVFHHWLSRVLPLWNQDCRQVSTLFPQPRFRPVLPHALEAVLRPEPKAITRLRMPTNR